MNTTDYFIEGLELKQCSIRLMEYQKKILLDIWNRDSSGKIDRLVSALLTNAELRMVAQLIQKALTEGNFNESNS